MEFTTIVVLHLSIAVLFSVYRPSQGIAQRLLAILNHVTADEMQNQGRYIQGRSLYRQSKHYVIDALKLVLV